MLSKTNLHKTIINNLKIDSYTYFIVFFLVYFSEKSTKFTHHFNFISIHHSSNSIDSIVFYNNKSI